MKSKVKKSPGLQECPIPEVQPIKLGRFVLEIGATRCYVRGMGYLVHFGRCTYQKTEARLTKDDLMAAAPIITALDSGDIDEAEARERLRAL